MSESETPEPHAVFCVTLTHGALSVVAGIRDRQAPSTHLTAWVTHGSVFVADTGNGAIRRIDVASQAVVALALRRVQ